jgi:hypothetical protein
VKTTGHGQPGVGGFAAGASSARWANAPGVVYTGPGGTYTLTSAQRAIAVALGNVLGAYDQNAKKCTNA